MTKYELNKKKLPDLDKFPTSKKSFLHDIHYKASKYMLSDKQIAAAQKAWDQEQAGPKAAGSDWKKFTDYQIELMNILFGYLSISWGGSPHSYEFMQSLKTQLEQKRAISPKQEIALIRKMLKIKKAVMKHVWSGH